MEFNIKNKSQQFSVECKWRTDFYKQGIEFAKPDQFKRYQKFENDRKMPVFIAIGVGGSGKNPDKLFIVPLNKFDDNFKSIEKLHKYDKKVNSNFYFDCETKQLR